MRRALRQQWPALSHFYGIHPWDVERLSFAELDAYVHQLFEREPADEMQAARARLERAHAEVARLKAEETRDG